MFAPSSLPCPEPMPFSDDINSYADIDFTVTNPPVFSAQPKFMSVDSILSNQLGNVTNPVQTPSSIPNGILGFPLLPEVQSSDAKPMLSSYDGSDIGASTTLANNNLNFLSVNDLVNAPANVANPPVNVVKTPSTVQQFKNTNKQVSKPIESFDNTPKLIGPLPKKESNMTNYIAKQEQNKVKRVEHFRDNKVEHFGHMSTMDNFVLVIVICAIVYYMYTANSDDSSVDTSKIPILSQLTDKNVSTENKLIIVVSIVIAVILIHRMLK